MTCSLALKGRPGRIRESLVGNRKDGAKGKQRCGRIYDDE